MFEESQVQDGFGAFPDEVQEAVDGLLWLGYLEDEFEFAGHTFLIRTLRGEEELLAALVTKEFVESLGQSRAWAWAIISQCVIAVDGDADWCPPIGPNKRDNGRAKFQYVTSNWYWPVAEVIYQKYAALLEEQATAMKAVEDLSQGSQDTFMPSPDSLTAKGDSEDIRQFLDPEDLADFSDESSNT